jgi:hypothetical protein
MSKPKVPYEKPTATKLSREHAKLVLHGHLMKGNYAAADLLRYFYVEYVDSFGATSRTDAPNQILRSR